MTAFAFMPVATLTRHRRYRFTLNPFFLAGSFNYQGCRIGPCPAAGELPPAAVFKRITEGLP
jgi:hypothetical protein